MMRDTSIWLSVQHDGCRMMVVGCRRQYGDGCSGCTQAPHSPNRSEIIYDSVIG